MCVCVQRRRLASRLFLAKESFCAPLMELKKHLVEIQVRRHIISHVDMGVQLAERMVGRGSKKRR